MGYRQRNVLGWYDGVNGSVKMDKAPPENVVELKGSLA